MPQGPGTYGSQKGRPKKKKNPIKRALTRIIKKKKTEYGDSNQGASGTDYNSGGGE
ncbi:MAG: hypothetical protein Unbinned5336contig1001_10 [Prokaryotic dsDNA virus sp.]|nr:MAG: hypothetical protein Unbinned5336contig1001_10 [Prokaryotic dsDNA virus sp.]|tara:strand:- start:12414 stop:12581 length:168 start_codon:yes stop_codon:yes gene_type:complete